MRTKRELPSGIYQRGASYYGRFKTPNGEVRRSLGRDRKKALAMFRRFREAGITPRSSATEAPRTTLEDVLDCYWQHQLRQHRDKPRTIENARHAIAKVKRLMDPAAPIETVTQDDFWRFREARAKEVRSTGSANVTLRYLKAALNRAVREGLISTLPFRVELLSEPPKRNRALSRRQVDEVLRVAKEADERVYMICFIAYTLGLRLSEIITGLWWRDVDLDEGWLQIEAKPQWSPKTRQRRVLTLDEETIKVLAEWRDKLRHTAPNDYVVPRDTKRGTPFTRGWAGERIAKVYKVAGVSGGVHRLRHTFVTEALEAGVPIHVVQRMAGHASVQTTLGHYAHVRDAALREATDVLALKRKRDRQGSDA